MGIAWVNWRQHLKQIPVVKVKSLLGFGELFLVP